jgi:Ca2+-binding RTX toxin-like protein
VNNDTSDINDALTVNGFVSSGSTDFTGTQLTTYALFAKRDADFSTLANQTLKLNVTGITATASISTGALSSSVAEENIADVLTRFAQAFTGTADSALNPSVTGRRVIFQSDWLINAETGNLTKPIMGSSYYYAPLNANFDVEEIDQVDVLNVSNRNSPSNDSGQLSATRLTGFGMGDDSVINGRKILAGISYSGLEELNIELGKGNDSLVIQDTHAGKTTLNGGIGDDTIAIVSTGGNVNISGGEGDDTVYVATANLDGSVDADEGRLETIMGHLSFDGGNGNDGISVDDSSDTSAEAGIVSADLITGFGLGSVSEVQTLKVVGKSGFYRVSRGDVNVPWYNIRPGVARPGAVGVVLDVSFNAAQVEGQLELIYGFGNVAVTLISNDNGAKTYAIEFTGQLSGADVAPIRWADPGPINLVANDDLGAVDVGGITLPNANSGRADVIIGTGTSDAQDPSGGNTQQFLEIVDADRGTFTITLLNQETYALPFDVTLEDLRKALEPILNPNNSDGAKSHTDNFDIEEIGGRFLLTFKGEHRDLVIKEVDVDVTELRGGTVELAVQREGLSYFNLEKLDLNLGDEANVLNIRGTSATTNINMGGGDDEIYVSSLSDLDFSKRALTFIGNLDGIQGTLNIDGGTGDQKLMISDASSMEGDSVLVVDRLPFRGVLGKDLTQLNRNAELFVIGASPAPISIQADRVDGAFRKGFRIETGSGDDTVNITDTIWRNRIADAAELELDTGLGNDNVFASLAAFGNSPLIIRTEGEFNYRMRLRGGLNIATLTNPADEISVTVDGNQLSNNQYRAVLDQNAIDLKISGNLSSESIVEAQITRVNRGRVSEIEGQREYVIDYQLHEGETVKLFSAGQELLQGKDYFLHQIRPQQFILVFNGRFNFFRNDDIVWEATRILSESRTLQSLGQRDDDFVNAFGSALPLSIYTGSGKDVIIGGSGDDTIYSGRGDDVVFGRSGADKIISVEGDQLGEDLDVIFGDDGIVKFNHFPRDLTIDSRNAGQQRLPVGDYRLSEVFSVDGGTAGDDVITSGNGDDILIGGFGADQLTSRAGSDILIGDSGKVIFKLGHLSQIKSTNSFDQSGTDDVLTGGGGPNYLIGGLGNDTISSKATDENGFSAIFGDLGEINFAYNASTGVNSVTGMASSTPGLGGNDRITTTDEWVGEYKLASGEDFTATIAVTDNSDDPAQRTIDVAGHLNGVDGLSATVDPSDAFKIIVLRADGGYLDARIRDDKGPNTLSVDTTAGVIDTSGIATTHGWVGEYRLASGDGFTPTTAVTDNSDDPAQRTIDVAGHLNGVEGLSAFVDPSDASRIIVVRADGGHMDVRIRDDQAPTTLSEDTTQVVRVIDTSVITSSGNSDWIIAGIGSDQLTIPNGAFFSFGIGSFSSTPEKEPLYFEWEILNSSQDSTGGSVITVDGFSLEENIRPVSYLFGQFDES